MAAMAMVAMMAMMVTVATMAMVAMMKRSESLSWRKKGLSFDYLIKSLLAAARPLSDESRGKHTLWARSLLYQPKLITDKLVGIRIREHVCGFYTCALTTYRLLYHTGYQSLCGYHIQVQ